jgi:hypothetical protein
MTAPPAHRQLAAVVDGRHLDEDDARALWTRFSAHMDAHEGDFAGFAASEGLVSSRVAVVEGVPTLTLERTKAAASPSPKPPAKGAPEPPKRNKRHHRNKRATRRGR